MRSSWVRKGVFAGGGEGWGRGSRGDVGRKEGCVFEELVGSDRL